jgi:tRNA(Ile)-lysidine synthase
MTLSKKDPPRFASEPRRLDADGFSRLMEALGPWPEAPSFAVAVSGGPDSMALTLLLQHWLEEKKGKLTAFTVDHRLRLESGEESRQIHEWLSGRGLSHRILSWDHQQVPQSAIHAQARTARYDLLIRACHESKATHLFLAQHADDQAETVLMRFAKGSGLDGLAGMASLREQDGITLARPLLPVRKSWLVECCTQNNWLFVTDPSNASSRFARGRLRGIGEELSREGLTTERLYELARSTGQVRAHLEQLANNWLGTNAACDVYGIIHFAHDAWKRESEDMQARLLARCLLCVSGEDYAPKMHALELLIENLCSASPQTQTLCGCRIECIGNRVTFMRETALVNESQPLSTFTSFSRWDRRFRLERNAQDTAEGQIEKLGEISRDQLMKGGFADIAALPAYARASLPALFQDGKLRDMPVFDAGTKRQSLIQAAFLPRRTLILKPFHVCPPLGG